MKILYITQYFHPEIGATTNRALANVRYLSKKGHDVTVLTEMPNHPKGIILDGYKKKLFIKEEMENFSINRVWVHTRQKKTFLTRILFYTTFLFLGTLHTVFNWKKYDLIYLSSPPLFVGSIGLNLKKIFPRTKLIVEIRDLWPDAAIEMGELNNKRFAKYSYSLEKEIYQKADHIITVTQKFKERIIKKDISEKKISVVRNGSDLSFRNVAVSKDLRAMCNAKNNFIVVYAGNLGLAQNLQTILDAAVILSKQNILFLLIGTGPTETELKDYAQLKEITSVQFVGEIPKEKMSQYFSIADCGIIPLKNINVFESTIPSKLFDYMSANLPILLGVKGEAAIILEESEAGISFEPENSKDLAEKILYLKNNDNVLQEMKSKGYKFVKKNYNRNKQAQKLEKIILMIMENKK